MGVLSIINAVPVVGMDFYYFAFTVILNVLVQEMWYGASLISYLIYYSPKSDLCQDKK